MASFAGLTIASFAGWGGGKRPILSKTKMYYFRFFGGGVAEAGTSYLRFFIASARARKHAAPI